MTHTLKLNKGASTLAYSILSTPGLFTTPSEIIRAAHLQDKLDCGIGPDTTQDQFSEDHPVDVTEAQRDLLKKAVEKAVDKIAVSKFSALLFTELGFEE